MRSSRLLTSLAALLLAACPSGPRLPDPQRLPDDVFDPAPWETSWAKDEADAWHEGTVVELPPGRDFRDEGLAPMADALVELLVPPPSGPVVPTEVVASARTGPDGRFRVGPSPAGAWLLRVTRPGCAPAWVGGGAGAAALGAAEPLPGNGGRVALRQGFEVRGRIADRHGRPVAGVRVIASSIAYREDLTTAADGSFTACAPRGPVFFDVDDVRFDTKPASVVVAEDGSAPQAEIRVRDEPPVRGVVVAGAERRPVPGAIVLCEDDPSVRTRTDDAGRFELRVARGRHVAAAAGGYGWRSCKVPEAGDAELRVLPVPPVSGVVVDPEGRPVPGARVTAVVLNFEGMFERVLGPRTGPDGRFVMSWLPRPPRGAAVPARLVATRRGAGESAIVDVTDEARAGPLRLVAGGVRDMRGRATQGRGTPLAQALVTARWGHWEGGVTPPEVSVLGLSESATTLTDSDGRWHIPGVPCGLHAKVECAWGGFVLERMIEGPAAARSFDFEFAGGGTIAGRVVAAGGRPAEGTVRVTAQLVNAEGATGQRAVDAAPDGRFRFEDLPQGSYQVRAEGERYDLASGGVFDTGNEDVTVTMQRSAKLSCRFDFEGGAPPDVPLLVTMTPESKRSQTFSLKIGAGRGGDPLVLTRLDPGAWKLTIAGDVWRGAIERVELGDGESKEAVVRVGRTIRVAVRVRDVRGEPIARQLVVVSPADPKAGLPVAAATGADGVADVTGLAPGRWTARCEHDGDVPFEVAFTVEAAGNPPVEMRAPAGGSIVVRAARDDGDPLPDAIVGLSSPDGAVVYAWGPGSQGLASRFRTDAQGCVSIRGVPLGRIVVTVSDGPSVLKKAEADVRADRPATIDVP